MPGLNISNTTLSNQSNIVTDYEVPAYNTDGAQDQKETTWTNARWAIQWGYFNSIPDLKAAIIMKAIWNVGKGYTTDAATQVILDHISGWGKESFEDILLNMDITSMIGGDAYAEIIWGEQDGKKVVLNLKPLNPGSIQIVVNRQGRIIRYEQINRLTEDKKTVITFEPENILHFSNDRVADQIHGISVIDALESTILADEENFVDLKKVMHRQARPMIIFKLKTDNQTVIDAFVAKMDQATQDGENVYIPDDENILSYEVVQIDISQFIFNWRNDIRNKFYRNVGLPQIVPGAGGNSTESESKTIYFAFETIVNVRQRQWERVIKKQLYLDMDLYPPQSMQAELQTDQAKDAGSVSQPSDLIAGRGR